MVFPAAAVAIALFASCAAFAQTQPAGGASSERHELQVGTRQ